MPYTRSYNMKLVQLIYYSKSASPLETKNAVLKSILRSAEKNNPDLGISGLLLFSNEFFLQALEGPRSQVNDLYFRIQKDPRHSDSQMLLYRDIHQRDFGNWSMGWANQSEENRDIYFNYCATRQFVPAELTGQGAHALLCEFARLARAD